MIQEILSHIYKIEVPLPENPLKAVNSYLIKGAGKSLLVDTGIARTESKEALCQALKSLNVEWSEVDFFITHLHGDHCGLIYDLAQKGNRVYCSKTDADLMKAIATPAFWSAADAYYIAHGYPKQVLHKQGKTLSGYVSGIDLEFTYVLEGDVIEVGDYRFVCIATPGHSPGHMCLYEPKHKLLISGDHILSSITSNIDPWFGAEDFLGLYLESLRKIKAMDIKLILPGHREIILDHHHRIIEIISHHDDRLQEILSLLQAGTMNAYQVASKMHWDLHYSSFEDFPAYQKWFAAGEAMAHLHHLGELQKVKCIQRGNKLVYMLLPETSWGVN